MKKLIFFALLLGLTDAEAQLLIAPGEPTAQRRRLPTYLVDATDGVTPETAITFTGSECRVSKAGAAAADCAGTYTHLENGVGYYEATVGEVDTLGALTVILRDSAARPFIAFGQVGLPSSIIQKTTFADDGQLTSESTVTLGLASGAITANNQGVGRAIAVYSFANRGIELARSCIVSSLDSGDTVTTKTDISGSITGAGGSADYYAFVDDPVCAVIAEYTAVPTAGTASLGDMLRVLYQTMVNKFDSTISEQRWYRADGSTVWTTKDLTDASGTYTRTAQETDD